MHRSGLQLLITLNVAVEAVTPALKIGLVNMVASVCNIEASLFGPSRPCVAPMLCATRCALQPLQPGRVALVSIAAGSAVFDTRIIDDGSNVSASDAASTLATVSAGAALNVTCVPPARCFASPSLARSTALS